MAKKPSMFRPVKRFKYRERGFRLRKIERVLVQEYVVNVECRPGGRYGGCEQEGAHNHEELVRDYKGVDPKRWFRLYPNLGYRRKNGNHWCRFYGKHPMAPREA